MNRASRYFTTMVLLASVALASSLEATPQYIRIASFNIADFGEGNHPDTRELNLIAKMIVDNQLDLVAIQEVGVGTQSLNTNTSGDDNTAVGISALYYNITGNGSTAVGNASLRDNTTGSENTAVGSFALGSNIDGDYNIAIGHQAGYNATTGDYNIYIGNSGVAAEGNTIRIGDSNQTRFFAAGVSGVDVGSAPVVGVTGEGQLGVITVGAGSGLDADTVDGQHSSAFMGAGVDNWVNPTGDTMTGTLTLNPSAGVGLSTTADINLEGRVMRGTTPFIHANTSLHNTAIGENALVSNTTGNRNTATGWHALFNNTTGSYNIATGYYALYANTTGSYNTAMGESALYANTTGSGNTAMGEDALYWNTTGGSNTAMGSRALRSNTQGQYNTAMGRNALNTNAMGYFNAAVGNDALYLNTEGISNTATGYRALFLNTEGISNTAMGAQALSNNAIGTSNTAMGSYALYLNTEGISNTATGQEALYSNTTGFFNIAVGYRAGYYATAGYYNIYIGNEGVAAEGNTIRIGDSNRTRFFAAGIHGVTTGETDAIPVLIDSAGQLGTVSSSIRFKEDVRDMSDASAVIFQLRPVTFRYKGRPDVQAERHYGLIAEEVNEVIPELVAHSADGQIEAVKYHELPAMLLNELQKQQRKLQAQEEKINELMSRLAQLESR